MSVPSASMIIKVKENEIIIDNSPLMIINGECAIIIDGEFSPFSMAGWWF